MVLLKKKKREIEEKFSWLFPEMDRSIQTELNWLWFAFLFDRKEKEFGHPERICFRSTSVWQIPRVTKVCLWRRGTFWKRRNDLVLIRYCALRWSPTSGEWLHGMVRNRVGWRQSRKAQWERQRQEQPNSADLSMPGGSRIFCSREQDSEGHLDRRSDHREVFRVT